MPGRDGRRNRNRTAQVAAFPIADTMRALILALNPSVDAEWRVERVRWGEKNTIESERRWAGGKGTNVARWLRRLGGEMELLLPLGGQSGQELARDLRAQKLLPRVIPIRQATRVNIIVTTGSRRQLRFNPTGPGLSRQEWNALRNGVGDRARRVALVVMSGSLPRGVPTTAYAELTRLAKRAGAKVLLDCDGPALAAGVRARPFLVKPNEHELAQWSGRALRSESEVVGAAEELSRVTGGWVLVSRGPRRAMLLNRQSESLFFAEPPRVRIRNSVGAGDAMTAAIAHQILLGRAPAEWLRAGVATGTAAAQCKAGDLAAPLLIRRMVALVRVVAGPVTTFRATQQ